MRPLRRAVHQACHVVHASLGPKRSKQNKESKCPQMQMRCTQSGNHCRQVAPFSAIETARAVMLSKGERDRGRGREKDRERERARERAQHKPRQLPPLKFSERIKSRGFKQSLGSAIALVRLEGSQAAVPGCQRLQSWLRVLCRIAKLRRFRRVFVRRIVAKLKKRSPETNCHAFQLQP